MISGIRILALAAAVAALTACGSGSKLSKDGAAQAVHGASGKSSSSSSGLSGTLQRVGGTNTSVSCTFGGEVGVTLGGLDFDFNNPGGEVDVSMKLTFTKCVEEVTVEVEEGGTVTGKVTHDGSMTYSVQASESGAGFRMKGKLTLTGVVDDFVDSDVTMSASATGITVNGKITTSSSSFTYEAETIGFAGN
jgi:hypothetical protein